MRLVPHPGRYVFGFGRDPQLYVWGFAWAAHAIGAGVNPLVSHALYAPTGVNMTWTPTAPLVAIVFAPLTALVGPVPSYDVANVVMPALAAWTAYLLCRYLTRSVYAALVGGYLYGFSTAMLRQQFEGHLNLTGTFLFPLVALALVRFVRGGISGRGLAWRLGLAFAAQIGISTELTALEAVALAGGLALAFGLVPDARPRLRAALRPLLAGCLLAGVLASPFLAYLLSGFAPGKFIGDIRVWGGTDVTQFAIPNNVIALGGSYFATLGSRVPAGESAYLGIPTLLVVVLYAWRRRRSAAARFLAAAFLAAAVVTLGVSFEVYGHPLFDLPWWLAAMHLPALDDALPFRFAIFAVLAAAVVVALWIARTPGRVFARPYVLPALAVAAIVPVFWQASYPSFFPTDPDRPAFFADAMYRSCFPRGETIAAFGDNTLLLQAESGFWFRMADDGLQPIPKVGTAPNVFDRDRIVQELAFVDDAKPTMPRLLAFAALHRVDRVVSIAGSGYPTAAQMRQIGPTEQIGGVLVAPACGAPSLTRRNLAPYVASYEASLAHAPADVGWCTGANFSTVPEGMAPYGPLAGARKAIFVAGRGVMCPPAPAGYRRHGFASPDLGVPAGTYPYYAAR